MNCVICGRPGAFYNIELADYYCASCASRRVFGNWKSWYQK